MKQINLSFIFLFIIHSVFSQEKDTIQIPLNENGLAEYSEVVNMDSISKNNLYLSAIEWINRDFVSGKAVIQTTDKEGGLIIGKANTHTLVYNNAGFKNDGGYFSFVLAIYIKDFKYKYVIDNIKYNKGEMMLKAGADLGEKFPSNWTGFIGDNKQTRREWKSFQSQADIEIRFIISDLKKHMNESKNKDQW